MKYRISIGFLNNLIGKLGEVIAENYLNENSKGRWNTVDKCVNFEFKYIHQKYGKNILNMTLEEFAKINFNYNGDFICYTSDERGHIDFNKPIYCIEVKSTWRKVGKQILGKRERKQIKDNINCILWIDFSYLFDGFVEIYEDWIN